MAKMLTICLLILTIHLPPAHAATININADINDLQHPVLLFLEAGTYSVDVIGTADGGTFDAWSNWSFTTCVDPEGCTQTVPTTVTGWKNSYDVIADALASVEVDGVMLTPVPTVPTGVDLIHDFFVASPEMTRYHVDDQMVYATPLGALGAATPSTFILASDGFVGFAINDIPIVDNRGGISLNVSPIDEPPLPEPGMLSLFVSGLAVYGATRYRKHHRCSRSIP